MSTDFHNFPARDVIFLEMQPLSSRLNLNFLSSRSNLPKTSTAIESLTWFGIKFSVNFLPKSRVVTVS